MSLVVNVVLAFVLIKFVVYPGLGLVLGTPFPIVAVVSNSMEHEGSFDVWWSAQEDKYLALNITKQVFERFPFKNGFNKGDIMVIVGTDPEDIEVGDVIVFEANKPYPIIHRVVHVWREDGKLYFRTKGDNNDRSIVAPDLNELQIDPAYYLGRAVFRIPYVGYVKIVFVDMLRAISGGLSVAR